MPKNIFLHILLFSLFFARNLYAQNVEEIKVPNINARPIEDITKELEKEKKANEPFDEKDVKVDLESLGLDVVEEKKEEKPQLPALPGLPIITVEEEKPKEIVPQKTQEITAQKAEQEKPVVKKEPATQQKTTEEKIAQEQKKLENAPKTEEIKIITQNKAKDETQKRIEQEQEKRAEIDKEDLRKKQEEKMLRLNKLREEYLVKLNENEQNQEQNEENDGNLYLKITKPIEKNLDWSDRFTSHEMPPPPLLDRFRGGENQHIPIYLNAREKVDTMFFAIAQNDIAAFDGAYNKILNPDIKNFQGETLLTYAVLQQRYPMIAAILKRGADPDLPNNLNHTPLEIAIALRDLKATQMLVDAQADPFFVNGLGQTYLMQATATGFYPTVDYLYNTGIDINATDARGYTALSIAFQTKQDIVAKYLQKKGAKSYVKISYEKPQREGSLINELENRWKKY